MSSFVVKNDAPLPLTAMMERRQRQYPFPILKKKGEYVDMDASHFPPGMEIEEAFRRTKNAAREYCRKHPGKIFVESLPEENPDTVRVWQLEDISE